jgi:uncharacterized protein (DUF1697 family)
MNYFVALLRGIGPGKPNMRPEVLKKAFVDQGFDHVTSILGTGNIVFGANFKSTAMMESVIEGMLQSKLGLSNRAMVRSYWDIKKLIESDPFHGREDIPSARFHVTFPKVASAIKNVPEGYVGKGFSVVKKINGCVASVSDTVNQSTPGLMSYLEKQMGKEITTRTWKTVQRIYTKFPVSH